MDSATVTWTKLLPLTRVVAQPCCLMVNLEYLISGTTVETNIHPDVVSVALEKVSGFGFENFSNALFAALLGANYVPMGGIKDGGADGFYEETIFEIQGKVSRFFQASIEPNTESKISRTLERLKEFGRKVDTLWFVTNQEIKYVDKFAEDLSEKFDVDIKIRDGSYIISHINDSDASKAAYHHFLASFSSHLQSIGGVNLISQNPHITDPAPYVFMAHEMENRSGNKSLIPTVCESLILWALNDTDPDKEIFRSREEIRVKIVTELPWAKHYINQEIDKRLDALSKAKSAVGSSRKIQYHKKKAGYCLPHETRDLIYQENASDELLKSKVRKQFYVAAKKSGLSTGYVELACDTSFRVLEKFYETQGLLFVDFLYAKRSSTENHIATLSTYISESLDETNATPAVRKKVAQSVSEVLRCCFYQSSAEQREYLNRLARTYVLLFTMRGDPAIVEFFQKQVKGYRLFVGTDVILLALTEKFIPEEDQRARTLLSMARDFGCKLYLTEPILEEIFTHIRGTDFEFANHFAEREPYITREVASHSNKILIRTYFYAKSEEKVKTWGTFLNGFADYKKIRTEEGKQQIKNYLINQFGLEYLDSETLTEHVKTADIENLAKALLDDGVKENEELARNDAIMVHSIYGLRRHRKEMTKHGEFGYGTWWLTHESRIQKSTDRIVAANHGARYVMRPAFLLNYFSLCPSRLDIQKSYRQIFPSVLGLQMGHRLDTTVFHEMLAKIDEWKVLEEGRLAAKLAQLSDELKTDHTKIHDFNFSDRISDDESSGH